MPRAIRARLAALLAACVAMTPAGTSLYAGGTNDSGDAIIARALDGSIVSWNRAAEQLFGYRAEEVIGRHFSIFYSREDIAAWFR